MLGPRTRILNWRTAVKLLLSAFLQWMKRTMGLLSPVCRFSLTLVFSSNRCNTCLLFSIRLPMGKLAVSCLTASWQW